MGNARVVLVSLDSFVVRHLKPEVTPQLCRLAIEGGFAPTGGRCDLPSVTYPSHATMLSGRRVGNHGVRTGRAGAPVEGVIPGWAGQPHVDAPTLFDACAAANVRSAAVLGDHKLLRIVNADSATTFWPPTPDVPDGVELDVFAYATNEAIHDRAVAAVADQSNRFVFVHYNETDTTGHVFGPDSAENLTSYSAVDALVGQLWDAAGATDELLFIVLSDHAMELFSDRPPIDPTTSEPLSGMVADTIDEMGSTLLRLRPGVTAAAAGEAALRIPGVVGWIELAEGVILLEAGPEVRFGRGDPHKSIKASHGGRSTAETLAVVAGGHPAVPAIAQAINVEPPHLADWAPTIASVLGIDMPPGFDGRDLSQTKGR